MSLHEYKRRVCYRDTDAMGIVYHGEYLGLMEEARCQWCFARQLGDARSAPRLAVRHVDIHYYRPARFGDLLRITGEYAVRGKASLTVEHHIYNDETNMLLCKASILLAHLNEQGKPTRMSAELIEEVLK